MTKKKSNSVWGFLLSLLPVIAGLVLLISDSSLQQALRNQLFDQYQRWYPRVYSEAPVRVVDIDDESLARLGQWPWPRTQIAAMVDTLGKAGVAAVGFDVMFSEPDRTSPQAAINLWQLQGAQRDLLARLPDHDAVLAQTLKRSDAVVGFALERSDKATSGPMPAAKSRFVYAGEPQNAWLHNFTGAVASLPAIESAAAGNGALTFVPDGDGVVRRVPVVLAINGQPVGTLAGEVLRVAQGAKNVMLKSTAENAGLAEIRIADTTIPTTPQGEIWVHYSRPVPERYIPAWKVLDGTVAPDQLSGNIILVGTSAQGLMDLRFNPFGLMPGVEAHAQALEQILTNHYLERPSWAKGLEALLLLVVGALAAWLALKLRAMQAALVTAAMMVVLSGGGWLLFRHQGLLLDSATPTIGVLLSFVLASLWHHLSSEREQRWIKQAFSRYVSPNRVSHLVDNPDAMELGGKRQECSFIFTDLAGFTSLMERMDPSDAVVLLNNYLDEMIAIAFRHDGTLDRIVGDAVAIMFSAPVPQADFRKRALACALEMDTFANAYVSKLAAEGVQFGKTRIGVHSGDVIVGNFGGSNMFDYRALGDPVNTAARLESVNKHLGTRMCVSEAIMADCPDVPVRPVGQLVLKGKSRALKVFEPVTADLAGRAPLMEYVSAYEVMCSQSPDAMGAFTALLAQWPEDPLVALHHRRLKAGEEGDLMVMDAK
jgi:adenylate cyclase